MRWILILVLTMAACSDDAGTLTHSRDDTGHQVEVDADDVRDVVPRDTRDVAPDTADTSPEEGTSDTAPDVADTSDTPDAEPCECTHGPCCDGCNYLAAGTTCEVLDTREYCSDYECGGSRLDQEQSRVCSGASASCNGEAEWRTVGTIDTCSSQSRCEKPSAYTACERDYEGC
jgi:hypothetical protein